MLRLLGPAMYKEDPFKVAIKELLQNSFDAVKKNVIGQIDIRTDRCGNMIMCSDNGVGMSSNTVRNVYLSIGGTLKDMDVTERSGGLGLAKVQFFLSAKRIVVNTVRNGEHTILDCTQEELLDGTATLKIEQTNLPNGTIVKLYYPKSVTGIDGSVTDLSMPYWFYILDHPLLGYPNVSVRYNNSICCKLSSSFTHKIPIEFSWGYVTIYYNPDSFDPNAWCKETSVYSAGLFQFYKKFRKDVIGYLKFDAKINIRPKVAAGMPGYPFNNTREGFNVSVQRDIDTISKYLFDIQSVLNSERIRRQFESLTSLQYMSVDGQSYEKKTISAGNNRVTFSIEFLEKLQNAFQTCSSIYEKKSIVEEAETSISSSKEDIAKLYGESLKLNNQTTGTYDCFELFSKVSSVLLEVIQKLDDRFNFKRTPTIAGILIQRNTYGALTVGSLNGIWINPLNSDHYTSGNHWVYDMMTTLIHELAHINKEYHGEDHNSEMMEVAHWLMDNNLYIKIEGQFMAIYNANQAEIIDGSRVFRNSCSI